MAERKSSKEGEVVINVSSKEEPNDSDEPLKVPDSPELDAVVLAKAVSFSSPSPEICKRGGSTHKPPKVPSDNNECLTRRRSPSRSVYSKPKSRFVEQSYQSDECKVEENCVPLRENYGTSSFSRNSLNRGSPNNKSFGSIASPALSKVAHEEEEEDEHEEIYKKVKLNRAKRGNMDKLALLELVLFLVILGTLIISITIDAVEKYSIWGLKVWRWCVLVMVTFSGMLVTNWFMHFVVFLIEKNYLLRKKVLYFVHGLKKSVQVSIWLSLVLLAWILLVDHEEKRSRKAKKFLDFITSTIISLLIGSLLSLVKTFALKVLASKFNVRNFFERIQESVFHQYVLQTLSGPPLIEEAERDRRVPTSGQLSITSMKNGVVKEKKVIDMGKVHKMKQEKVSASTMKVLIEAVKSSHLSTISNTYDEFNDKQKADKEISNEMEAVAAAYDIFNNVDQENHGYIGVEDLMRFMIKEEVDLILPLIEGTETGKITRKAFTEWVVKVYTSRKALGHSLNDTKTAVKQLDKLITGILTVITFIIWLILLEVAKTNLLLLLSSQFVALAFMIGGTCKNIFESFIFVFVMHPYDVGDRCVIDGVMLLVEEIDLLTTVFLKIDNEKVFYPNAVLASKPISNYYRSPDMGDGLEFSIAFTTPVAKFLTFKERVKEYLEQNPHHFHPEHTVVLKEIENMNKIKMAVFFLHTITFQQFQEKNLRKTEFVIAIKKIFEDLQIQYSLLPQDVYLTQK